MKLYEYQKELLNSEGKNVLLNWCRRAGMDTALATYILEHKPSKILFFGFSSHTLIQRLNNLQVDYNMKIEKINKEDYIITFLSTEKVIEIMHANFYPDSVRGKKFDLIIDTDKYNDLDLQNLIYGKYIKCINKNINNFKDNFINRFDQISSVDHRRMLDSNKENLELVIVSARKSDKFFDEYALVDAIDSDSMSFPEFQTQALRKLMKQFLNTPDSKDTVLTRKNIIEMIKDLQQLK